MNIRLFLFTFSVFFAKIWHNFANIIQNKLKFLMATVVVTVRNRKALLNCLIEAFLAKIFDKIFKIQNFFIKNGTKYAFLVHFVKVCQI